MAVQRTPRLVAMVLSMALAAGALAGCGGSAPAQQGGTGGGQGQGQAPAPAANAKPYAGTTLRFLAANHPWTETIKGLLPQFEEKTGIKVNLESIAENQLLQKLTVELTSGAGTVDVFMGRPLQEAKLFYKNGWYADLGAFVKDEKKTPKEYDFNDFFPSAVQAETVNGTLIGIPVVTEQHIIYYRKDLFEQKKIKVPTTMEELEAAAKALHDPDKGIYGIVMRGQGNPAVTQFSSFLYSFGGDWTKDGKAALDTPEAIKAFETYGRLLRNYGPPGVLNMSWPQAAALFAQGKAAMWLDANSLFLNVTDKEKSTVGDKVGFAMFPAGDKGAVPYTATAWGLHIAKSSKHPDAAWELVKFLTSKEVTLQTQAKGNPSARASVWDHPDGKKAWPPEWVEVAIKSSKVGRPYDRPLVVNVSKARDIIGEVITAAITGKDVKAAAAQANKAFQDLLNAEAQ